MCAYCLQGAGLKMRPSGFFANLDFVIIIKKRRFIIPIIVTAKYSHIQRTKNRAIMAL